ncbi:TPA: hypothetical protein ACGHO4_004832, partial [Salmonella enterica subsp. diarizonae serovar 61:i:z]
PLSKVKLAVALVSKWSTNYSGGGREEEYANFMMINDDGTYQPAFKNILFSSKEMIKACFTEDDYAKQSHCHDECTAPAACHAYQYNGMWLRSKKTWTQI